MFKRGERMKKKTVKRAKKLKSSVTKIKIPTPQPCCSSTNQLMYVAMIAIVVIVAVVYYLVRYKF